MAQIRTLLDKLPSWQAARPALDELARLPLPAKREQVYPEVIRLAARYWCQEEGASSCGYEVENLAGFLIRELAVEPSLSAQLYAAMKPPKLQLHHFYPLVRAARDPGALPLLHRAWKHHHFGWGYAVIAVHDRAPASDAVIADVIAAMQAHPSANETDLAIAAGFLAGERAIEPLLAIHASNAGYRKDAFGLGLALAGHDDEAWFKALATARDGAAAKRIFAALYKPKQKDRLAAIEALGKNIDQVKTMVSPATLLAASRLLTDEDALVAERAAKLLADYPGPRSNWHDNTHHAYVDRQARTAILRGVSPATRASLDVVQRSIPRSEPLPAGPTIATPEPTTEPRKAAAEARARQTLDAMGIAAPAKPAKKPRAAPSPAKQPMKTALGDLAQRETLRDKLPSRQAPRNRELEAAIVEEPTDRARYLVYGDWLQQQGDPRGTLIALMDAAERGDRTARDAYGLLIDEHWQALGGFLDNNSNIHAEWVLGFIQHAQIQYVRGSIANDLRTLFTADATRFLRSLAIDVPKNQEPIDTTEIVEVLIEHAPKTLSKLRIGKAGSFTPSPELRAALPRLQRDPVELWTEVRAAMAEQTKLKSEIEARKLPLLEPVADGIAIDTAELMRGLKAELDKGRPIGAVAALPQVVTRDSLDRFACKLGELWHAADSSAAKWAFDALGPLGGDRTAAFLGAHLLAWSHARSVQACEQLRRIGTDLAITELAGLVFHVGGPHPRRNEARAILEALAKQRGSALATLLIRACPVSFPDDAATVARFRATQLHWLSHLMIDGVRLSEATFQAQLVQHPHRGALVASLVWGHYDGRDLKATFAVARDGSLRGVDGSPFTSLEHPIGLVHPVELTPAQLASWQATFAKRDIEQAIPQLARPFFTLTDEERELESLTGFAKRRVGFYALRDALEPRDWVGVNDSDGGGTDWWEKTFPRDHATIIAELNSTHGSIANVHIDGARSAPSFRRLHPVTISELLYDLEVAHGWRPRPTNDRIAPAPAAAGPGPIVERAKSGRSKCVVCTNAIAKGEPRVGVERLIETPQFTGRGTVWAHPGCRAGMPELEGVALDDLLATV